jgi:DNA-binding NtrC family response regulator
MLPSSTYMSAVPLDAGARRPTGRVLVVDDEFLIRWSLRERLVADGFDVVEAGSGAGARAAVKTDRFDVIILDVRLPDADGLGLLAEFLVVQPAEIIMITAHGSEEMADEARKMGAYAFMRKPFDVDYMVELVCGAIDRADGESKP